MSDTPRTDAFASAMYNHGAAAAAGYISCDMSPEDAYREAIEFAARLERELLEARNGEADALREIGRLLDGDRISDSEMMQLLKRVNRESTAWAQRVERENNELRAGLQELLSYGCPACSGDCAAANPSMICPMRPARALLAKYQEAK